MLFIPKHSKNVCVYTHEYLLRSHEPEYMHTFNAFIPCKKDCTICYYEEPDPIDIGVVDGDEIEEEEDVEDQVNWELEKGVVVVPEAWAVTIINEWKREEEKIMHGQDSLLANLSSKSRKKVS